MITVVSGLPRSGTSLAMQMLEAGGMPVLVDGVRAPDRDNPRGYYEYDPVKHLADDCSWLERAEGRAVKIVYALLRCLPRDRAYRVVFMERSLEEVVASQNAMLRRLGKDRGSLDERQVVAAFQRQLRETLAWLSAQAHMQVLRLRYAALLRDPEETAGTLVRFLDAPLDTARMAAAVDPSLHRMRGSRPKTEETERKE